MSFFHKKGDITGILYTYYMSLFILTFGYLLFADFLREKYVFKKTVDLFHRNNYLQFNFLQKRQNRLLLTGKRQRTIRDWVFLPVCVRLYYAANNCFGLPNIWQHSNTSWNEMKIYIYTRVGTETCWTDQNVRGTNCWTD